MVAVDDSRPVPGRRKERGADCESVARQRRRRRRRLCTTPTRRDADSATPAIPRRPAGQIDTSPARPGRSNSLPPYLRVYALLSLSLSLSLLSQRDDWICVGKRTCRRTSCLQTPRVCLSVCLSSLVSLQLLVPPCATLNILYSQFTYLFNCARHTYNNFNHLFPI